MKSNVIERKDELDNLNFIKVVLMCVIVIYHSFLLYSNLESSWASSFGDFSYQNDFIHHIHEFDLTYHTRVFFIVSGYLFYYLKHEQNKYQKFGSFILNKFLRLFVPAILVSMIISLPTKLLLTDATYTFLDLLRVGFILDQMWFLGALFFAFIILYIFDKFIYKHTWISLAIFLVLNVGAIALLNLVDFEVDYLKIISGIEFVFYLILGYKFRQINFVKLRKIKWWVYLIIVVGIYSLGEGLYFYTSGVSSKIGLSINYLCFYINPICIFYMLQGIGDKINKKNKIFKFLSRRTMVVYLLHQQFIYVAITLIPFINPFLNGFLNFVIASIGALLLGSLLLLTKPTAFMLGEKQIKINDCKS